MVTAIGGSLIPPACRECHNCGSLIPPMRIDATIGVAYYPFMAPVPQWELPHTKVEQAHRTVGLLHKDFHYSVRNQKLISNAIPFEYIDVPLPANSQKLDLTMEVISIERSTYEVIGLPLRSSKNC